MWTYILFVLAVGEIKMVVSSAELAILLDHREKWKNHKSFMHKIVALFAEDKNTESIFHSAK